MHRVLILAASVWLLTGCAPIGAAIRHTGTGISAAGSFVENFGGGAAKATGDVIKEGSAWLPSPWREAVYGAGAVIGLLGANTGRKKLTKKLKASKPGEILGDDTADEKTKAA